MPKSFEGEVRIVLWCPETGDPKDDMVTRIRVQVYEPNDPLASVTVRAIEQALDTAKTSVRFMGGRVDASQP